MDACRGFSRRVNPRIDILTVSARTGDGLPAFYRWIETQIPESSPPTHASGS
jgi:hydrogenase nickel incorporation protein HypB